MLVEIQALQDSIVLRARGSELLILPYHVQALKRETDTKEFTKYFLYTALVNRPARKLFESWWRKDPKVWNRLWKVVQEEIELKELDGDADNASGVAKVSPTVVEAQDKKTAPKKADTPPVKPIKKTEAASQKEPPAAAPEAKKETKKIEQASPAAPKSKKPVPAAQKQSAVEPPPEKKEKPVKKTVKSTKSGDAKTAKSISKKKTTEKKTSSEKVAKKTVKKATSDKKVSKKKTK